MKLETERLILRELKDSDAKEIARYTNNKNFVRYIPPIAFPYKLKDAKEYIKKHKKEKLKKKRNHYVLAIELKTKKIIVGIIEISIGSMKDIAQLDYALNQEYWRQGIMSEAAKSLLDFTFNKLKIRKITSPILKDNKASNALIKKLGFKLEGTLREQEKVSSTGKIHDENIYGLLKNEWKIKRRKLK